MFNQNTFVQFNAAFLHLESGRGIKPEDSFPESFVIENADAEKLQVFVAQFPVGSVFEVSTQRITEF